MNKTLLVLGSSSDFGLALIEKAQHEFDIIIAHYFHMNPSLNALKEALGEKLQLVSVDFRQQEETERFIEKIENEIGIPTHIVHLPASRVRSVNFHKSEWQRVEDDINISLRSIYLILNRFIRFMAKEKHGKIVFMLTSCTVAPEKFMLDYTTVKFALLGFMKSLAAEYAAKGITVNAVSPAMVDTKFLRDLPHLHIEQAADANPLKRIGVVDEIVPAIMFLLSDEAGYITGQNLVISGGSAL